MFGVVEGFRTYKDDQAKLAEMAARKALLEAQTVTEQGKPAMQEREMTLQEAQEKSVARFREAQASTMEAKLAEEKRILDAYARGAKPTGENTPQNAEQFYSAIDSQVAELNRIGRPDKAMELMSQAAQVHQREGAAAASAQRAKASQIEKQIQVYGVAKDLFGAVTDEISHARAVMAYDSLPFAKEFPLNARIKERYSPDDIKALVAGATQREKEAQMQLERDKLASLEESRKGTAAYRRLRVEHFDRQIELREREAERKAKVDGGSKTKPVKGPAETQVKQAIVELKRLKMDPSNEVEKQAMGRMIAADALTLQNTHPTLSYEEALARAIDGAKSRGDVEPETTFGFATGRKFDPKFGSASRPLDANALKSPADLKPNMYVRGKDGSVQYWDGSKLTPVKPPASAPPAQGSVFDDEDLGDDE